MSAYLIAGMTQRALLGTLITLSGHVLYPHYGAVPGLAPVGALGDQHVAGAIMWFGSGIVLLAISLLVIWHRSEAPTARPGGSMPESWPSSSAAEPPPRR